MKESRNVGHDGRAALLPFEAIGFAVHEFWDSLKEIAKQRGMTLGTLVAAIDGDRQHTNLSSAIRLFVLGVYRDQRR